MDDLADAAPLCGDCGVGRLEPTGRAESAYLECGACGWIAVAV